MDSTGPSSGTTRKYRWGILGTGYAADQFTQALSGVSRAEIHSVASQSADRANQFAKRFGIQTSFGSYQELIASDAVDIVYVAAVAPMHRDLCLAAIASGKAVLCEKPFAMNADEASEIADAAGRAGVFCMEAMWSRFIPLMTRVRQTVHDGVIGSVVCTTADFGLRQTPRSSPRLFHPDNGGALRDLGVYPISLAVEYLGPPDSVDVFLTRSPEGVDTRASGVLGYRDGQSAFLLADITTQTPTTATIIGSTGYIEIETPMYRPTRAKLFRTTEPADAIATAKRGSRVRRLVSGLKKRLIPSFQTITSGYQGNGYQYQAIEVIRCLDGSLLQSPVMPLSQSVDILKVVDRAQGA